MVDKLLFVREVYLVILMEFGVIENRNVQYLPSICLVKFINYFL